MKIRIPCWLSDNLLSAPKKNQEINSGSRLVVLGTPNFKRVKESIGKYLAKFEVEKILKEWEEKNSWSFLTEAGWIWVLKCAEKIKPSLAAPKPVASTLNRNRAGEIFRAIESAKIEELRISFFFCDVEQIDAVFLGLEMAQYRYQNSQRNLPMLWIESDGKPVKKEKIFSSSSIAKGVNLARHLVNLPPNELNPSTFAIFLKEYFSKSSSFSVQVWDSKKLEQEKMGLHVAVGQGAEHSSRLVILKYRPRGYKGSPVAFVGKGITFDTGGLDLKPSKGMRLMKKDMGGAAALAGLAAWLETSSLKIPVDFYFALAENSLGSRSFRPSDVYTARNGQTVEIDNTDAEGRLVLADSLTLATESQGKDRPKYVVNVATLTGAGKIALGRDLAGLYTNSDELAKKIQDAANSSGDGVWLMPLYSKYWDSMKSNVADMVNCSDDSYGSAISAALFLEKFLSEPAPAWAHLDIFAWQDRPEGPYSEKGGSGQSVLCLAQFLENLR